MHWNLTNKRRPRHDPGRSSDGTGGSPPSAYSPDSFPTVSAMATIITGPDVDRFRTYTLLCALKLEIKGLKRNGPSAFSIIKKEYNLKGSKQSVHDQLQIILAS